MFRSRNLGRIIVMRRKNGFTLIEVQIASVLVAVILVATGVVFHFALASMRYMQDAYEVYWNAHIAMKVISTEVMRANRYGWSQGNPIWLDSVGVPHPVQDMEPYGINMPDNPCVATLLPTLRDQYNGGTYTNTSSALYLRQERLPLTLEGNISGNPQDYRDDELVLLYWDDPLGPNDEPRQLKMQMDRALVAGASPLNLDGTGDIIASNIAFLQFTKIAFNCIGVRLRVEGRIPSPLGGRMNQIELNTMVTLRCAAAETCEPWGTVTATDNMW